MTWRRYARGLLLVAGLGVGVTAFVTALRASQDTSSPPITFMIAAFALVAISLQSAGYGWVTLFDGTGDRLTLTNALFASQLAKYLPGGGVLQIAGQVSMSRDESTPLVRVSMIYPVNALVTVAASSTVAGALLFTGADTPSILRFGGLAGLISPIVLSRSASRRLIDAARKVIHRIPSSDLLPSQRSIWRSFAWGLPMMTSTAVAFSLLLQSLDSSTSVLTATGAFAAAWVVGFLVVPLPAGAGVREGVLVLALGASAPTSVIIAASLAHRVVTILGEIVMIVIYRIRIQRRARLRETLEAFNRS